MIAYADGVEARPGDCVDLYGTPGVVEVVIDTESERDHWGLDERGLMIKALPYGLVFQSIDSVCWPAVILPGRADA